MTVPARRKHRPYNPSKGVRLPSTVSSGRTADRSNPREKIELTSHQSTALFGKLIVSDERRPRSRYRHSYDSHDDSVPKNPLTLAVYHSMEWQRLAGCSESAKGAGRVVQPFCQTPASRNICGWCGKPYWLR